MSGFTPVTYPVSSECGQYDPQQDQQIMETLKQAKQQLDCHPPKNRSNKFLIMSHQLPQATTRYVFPMAHQCKSTVTWREPTVEERRLDESDLCQHVTFSCHLPSRTDTDNPLRTDSLWPEWCRMSEHSVLHTRTELLSSVWTTTRLSIWYTRCFPVLFFQSFTNN